MFLAVLSHTKYDGISLLLAIIRKRKKNDFAKTTGNGAVWRWFFSGELRVISYPRCLLQSCYTRADGPENLFSKKYSVFVINSETSPRRQKACRRDTRTCIVWICAKSRFRAHRAIETPVPRRFRVRSEITRIQKYRSRICICNPFSSNTKSNISTITLHRISSHNPFEISPTGADEILTRSIGSRLVATQNYRKTATIRRFDYRGGVCRCFTRGRAIVEKNEYFFGQKDIVRRRGVLSVR